MPLWRQITAGAAVVLLSACLQSAQSAELDGQAATCLSRGTAHLKRGEVEAARALFEQTLKMEPNCYQALNNIGLCYMRQGQLNQAADRFRQALKINPTYVGSLNNLGIVNYLQGRYEEAIIFYEQALSLCQNRDAEIQTNLANALRDKNEYAQAIDHYRQSIKLEPDYAPAYNNLGLTLLNMHKEQEAAVEVTKAIKLKPDYAQAYYNLGLIRQELKQIPEARAALESSLRYETNPGYAEATRKLIAAMSSPPGFDEHMKRGYVMLEANQWAQAQAEFQAALSDRSDSALAWNNLGLAYSEQKKFALAVAAFNKALSLRNGSFAAAHYNLGQALRARGDRAGAEKAFRQAIKDTNGKHAYAHVALGLLLKEKGDVQGAIKAYRLAILQSGDTLPVVHYDLAVALEHAFSTRESVREYQIYLSQAPQGLNVNNARCRLKRLGVEPQ